MEQILTVSEVAKQLRMSQSTVYKYAETGKIPSFKIGSSLRFTGAQIEGFLSAVTRVSERSIGQEQ
jgi:PTS system nitrogen regulatory IIA component